MLNIRKFFKGLRILPTTSLASDSKGELEVDNSTGKLNFHNGTSRSPVLTEAHTATITNKTLDVDNNTVSNIEVDNLKSGVLNTSTSLASASNTQVPSALAAKTYTDNVAADEADAVQTNLTAHIDDATEAHAASAISNTPSGNLAATDVQSALNELQSDINTRALTSALTDHLNDTEDAHDASAISVAPTGNLAATDVQGALAELQTDVDTRATSSALTTHTGATSAHGVSGSIVGTSDAQTLSNKTFSDAIILDEIATPSTPASGKGKIYFKNDGFLYQLNDDGSETKVGAGSGGINYITNPDAESNTTGYNTYADAAAAVPVDGTGGSANITFTRSTSSPLRGTASFLITKDAANRQGQGVSYDIDIASADQAQVLRISFDYSSSAGYVDDYLRVYVYDRTNSQLIEVVDRSVLANAQGKYLGSWQSNSNSTAYRVIFHVADSSSTA